MLYEFLEKNEKTILGRAISKTIGISQDKPSTRELEKGLPLFYKDLILALKKGPDAKGSNHIHQSEELKTTQAASHGKESQRLGYTVSQVVHGYGTLCQSVTEYAQEQHFDIEAWEFRELNLLLDIAIAQAVTQYTKLTKQDSEKRELLRLGELAHELRNTLASATLAQEMIMRGTVGTSGNTSRILVNAHSRMRELIDKSLSEVRLQISPDPNLIKINLLELISDIEATAVTEARSKSLELTIEVDASLYVNADRQLLETALANLVQNALKYTKPNTSVCIRSKDDQEHVLIEVEDECGGLPAGKAEELFKPYIQKDADKSGLGLGLTISKRAVELNHGTIFVKNLSGKGCIFSIRLPKM
jgi:signal transduction histidine kinase